ncbi:hypothetical protein SCUCBS95973_003565 [Sporothrix curviconia]|uniref:Short chain dehydrogenase reductase n=1 Tax=Sporothrix curviconia TaxID=1260050 RepID=A0ABP0BHT7_9PEZI
MPPRSIDMGDEAVTSLFPGPFIKSQFRTKTRLPPPGTDLTGHVAIITGGNSGIGFHAAEHLLSLKLSRLIIAVRTLPKGESAAARLLQTYPAAKIEVWPLEMTSYASIQAFAARVASDLPRLDFTILNAGIMKPTFGVCASTGHEEVVQVNFLSTYLLAILMLPLCKAKAPASKPGRLTIVSSGTSLTAKFVNRDMRPLLASFDAVDPKGVSSAAWDPTDRYFTSKMLGHLFFVRLLKYLRAEDVIVNLVEPGMCKSSDLHRDLGGPVGLFIEGWKNVCGRKPQDGAWTYVDAVAVKGPESHGCFLMDWEIHPFTKLVYEPQGKAIMDALWEEVMAEYAFADRLVFRSSILAPPTVDLETADISYPVYTTTTFAMTETASPSPTPEDAAAVQARRRKERREAKIKAGGSARLNKITGLGGGLQRDTPAAPKTTQATEHGDPDEVDISEHFYQPTVTPRPNNAAPQPNSAAADAQMRQLLLAQQRLQQQQPPNPFLFGDGPGGNDPFGLGGMGGFGAGGPGGEGTDGDPMAAMLSQMMQAMGGGAGGPGGPGAPGGGFPGFPGFPGMGAPGQQKPKSAIPSTPEALWRLVHFAVAVALGLYVALATPFMGTRSERDLAAAAHTAGADGTVFSVANDAFALHKRYFFYAFATAETILLTSRIFLERGGNGGSFNGGAAGGMVGMAMGFLPPTIKRNVEIAMRYWQIFSTVRSDLMVCVFVLGVCAWLRS